MRRVSVLGLKALWLLVCVAGLLSCSNGSQTMVNQLAAKERLVDGLKSALLTEIEEQRLALFSPNEQESKQYAAKAAQSASEIAELSEKLEKLVLAGKDSKEIEAVELFKQDYQALSKISSEIISLSGRNTNIRASVLSRGEAAKILRKFQDALGPFVDGSSCQAEAEALRASMAALGVYALHSPHIDEASDSVMDSLEAQMRRKDALVKDALEGLRVLAPQDAGQLKAASAAYAEFWRLTQEIVVLSRENSNVRGQALIFGQHRLLSAKCLDDLAAIKEILASKQFKATR